MTRWATGADQISDMLAAGELEQVTPSQENSARLLAEADRHLRSAELLAAHDPAGAYDMLYSAARKAMAAALARQGLRATSKGGHLAVQEAVTGQLGTTGVIVRPFGRLRRTRNDADYPRLDSPELTAEDVHDDLPKARQIVGAMTSLIPHLRPWQ
ncbi:MAG: HEPN domain-containing protein [Actinomycetales bacterium]|uniref:HEPN domain-containing protein n=1 Tax=Candidatus Phosphoribacter hodrii TaxID=2953743 RepID=A0A935M5E6_9MICO|nr:HEPN domain-containing protein [Candidatus Phosphoribacter hodrii]MBK7271749.1 HEPN domain-containing protein [Candidatus Phosphoribacter hodrii]HBY24345.1 hypothetical protein [Propionibacteriaceae bacterium]